MPDSPTPTLGSVWNTLEIRQYELSHAAALMFLTLEDVREVRHIDGGLLTGVWRRWCASNLVYEEWRKRAWAGVKAESNARRALRELVQGLGWVEYGRIKPVYHYLVEEVRERYEPAMPVQEFVAYARKTHERVTGKFAR